MLSINDIDNIRLICADKNLKIDFISKPLKVDFIAYHDLQAQTAQSVYDEMGVHFKCAWRIGPNQIPNGAQAAIMLDHQFHHPKVVKSQRGYKYLFYLSHDLADLNVYEAEKEYLRQYDIVFVPGTIHHQHALKALGKNTLIIETGWPKYDLMKFPEELLELRNQIAKLPYQYTILYAPTSAHTGEWKYLLPLLKNLPCNVILKNHIYVNKGQVFPKGQEEIYQTALNAVEEMEKEIVGYAKANMLVVPRNLNICSLFPFTDILISDQSSVLLEFVPFGASIETGRYNANENDFKPEISGISKEVAFMDKGKICAFLSSIENIEQFLSANISPNISPNINYVDPTIHAGKLTALLIDRYVYESQQNKWSYLTRETLRRGIISLTDFSKKLVRILKKPGRLIANKHND